MDSPGAEAWRAMVSMPNSTLSADVVDGHRGLGMLRWRRHTRLELVGGGAQRNEHQWLVARQHWVCIWAIR